jgi:iron complex outermembrane receptor protein
MSYRKNAARLLAGSALALAFTAPAAFAADTNAVELETLIVTASKRAENIQDVPMSVSAVSGDYIEKAGVTNATDLARFIPSVAVTQSNNNRNTTLYVRGIGTSGTNPGIESSVGIFIDGVYILAAGPLQSNLQDVSTIEVLRGPQGTLYGRNTPVGAINITTRAPTQAFEGMIGIRSGDYDDRQFSAYVGGGLSETLAGRLSFWIADRDGYETNLYTGDDVNGVSQYGVRGRLKWTPNDKLTGNFIGYFTRMHSNCCTADQVAPTSPTGIATPGFLAAAAATGHPFRNFTDGDHIVDDNYESLDITEVYGGSATFDYDLGGHTLTSITAFNGYTDDIRQLAADMLPQATATGAQYLRAEGWSEELRIASPADQKLTYLGGVYLFSESMTYTTLTTLDVNANRVIAPNRTFIPGDSGFFYYTQKTKSAAVFGQATYHLTDALRLNGGLRYSTDEKHSYVDSYSNPTASVAARAVFPTNHLGKLHRSENKLTWSATVQYDITPDVMAYVLAATGYKTGGFNARAAAAGVPIEFNAENSKTYEAGIKSIWLENRLVLNVDVYKMTLSAFQDSILNPLTGTGFVVANAGDREVKGVEADAQFHPIAPLTIKGTASYMDGEFTDYSAGQCYNGKVANGTKPGTCSYDGLTPAQTPKWSWSLAAQWQAPLLDTGLEWFANGDVSYTGSKYLDPLLDPRGLQPSVTLYGARIGISSPTQNWRISIYGKNLTDESYYAQKTTQPLNAFISGGGTATAGGFVGWYAPPRTIGAEATLKF